MNFRAFDICYTDDHTAIRYQLESEQDLFKSLNNMPRIEEGTFSYATIHMHEYENFILGTLAQSYYTVLTAFEGQGKKEKQLDENNINDKTFFYIDTVQSRLYIQGKLYPAVTLNKSLTLARMNNILNNCLQKQVVLQKAQIDYTDYELAEIFNISYVKKVIFKNIRGIELPLNTVLHNPRADWDRTVAESWNAYSKDTLDYLELRAQKDEKLNKNPIAKIGITLAEIGNSEGKPIINELEIIDGGEKVPLKPSGNANKVIYVPKSVLDDSYEVYDKILKKESRQYEGRF